MGPKLLFWDRRSAAEEPGMLVYYIRGVKVEGLSMVKDQSQGDQGGSGKAFKGVNIWRQEVETSNEVLMLF